MKDTKEFKTIDEQIKRLQARNLKFKNIENAKKVLIKYNYFDVINGFETILLYDKKAKIYKNVYFEDFYDLYKFDARLKKETLALIFDFESRLKTSIAYHFSEKHCNTKATIMNYINPSCYKKPPKQLYLKFKTYILFKGVDKNGKTPIDKFKEKSPYIASFKNPPFWVTIKQLTIGNLYYLFIFLEDDVKEKVLNDFGLSLPETQFFIQTLFILKEARNQCAHLELISRFEIDDNKTLNYFKDSKLKLGLTHKHVYFLDLIKILKFYNNISHVKSLIIFFYVKMSIKGRKNIADKILGKMGRKNLKNWIKL